MDCCLRVVCEYALMKSKMPDQIDTLNYVGICPGSPVCEERSAPAHECRYDNSLTCRCCAECLLECHGTYDLQENMRILRGAS